MLQSKFGGSLGSNGQFSYKEKQIHWNQSPNSWAIGKSQSKSCFQMLSEYRTVESVMSVTPKKKKKGLCPERVKVSQQCISEPFWVEMQRRGVTWVTCKYPRLKSWAFAKLAVDTSLIFSSKSVLFKFFTSRPFLRILRVRVEHKPRVSQQTKRNHLPWSFSIWIFCIPLFQSSFLIPCQLKTKRKLSKVASQFNKQVCSSCLLRLVGGRPVVTDHV